MKQWPKDEALQLAVCATLAQLATDERGGTCVIVEHNGLALLFDALIRLALQGCTSQFTLLYQYKSTNTDTSGAACQASCV